MSDEHQESHGAPSAFSEHRLMLLIVGSIVIALILVVISMELYARSGAAQLDLTRPGYKSVQSKAKPIEKYGGFPADGPIDAATLKTFKELYSKQAAEATGIEVFGGDVLSDQVLKLDNTEQSPATTVPQ